MRPGLIRLPLLLTALVAAAAFAASDGATAAGGGGGPSCSENGPVQSVETYLYDNDVDGFNDTWQFNGQWLPGFMEVVWFNVTVYWPNFTLAGEYDVQHMTDTTVYTHESYSFFTLNATDPYGTYSAFVVFEYSAVTCEQWWYYEVLAPPGNFQPRPSAAVPEIVTDQNTTVDFAVEVRNAGNLPDNFSVYVNDTEDWGMACGAVPALDAGAAANLTCRVVVPLNARPLLASTFNITVQSHRNPLRYGYLDVVARVAAQVFDPAVVIGDDTLEGENLDHLLFNFTVSNNGNNNDTVAVAVPAAPTGWQRSVTGPAVWLNAGESRVFTVDVLLPASYTSDFSWDPTVVFTSADGVHNLSFTIHARLMLPDFIVGPSGILLNNSVPRAGEPVTVTVTVLNVGAPIEVTFAVSLTDGNVNLSAITDMHANGQAVATFSISLVALSNRLVATADSTGSVPEENDANNVGSLNVTTNQPPSAGPGATVTGHPADNLTFTAAGATDADGAIVAFFFDFGDGSTSGWTNQSTVVHAYAAAGNYTAKLRVRDNRGAESGDAVVLVAITPVGSGENNNSGGGGGGGTTGPTGGGDLSFLILAALLALAALAALLLMKRRGAKPAQAPAEAPKTQAPPPPPPA